MKRMPVRLAVLALALSVLALSACQPAAPKTPAYQIEVIGRDGKATTVDLGTLTTVEGKGGFKKTTGTIVGPDSFSGVKLADVLEKAGDFTDKDALEVIASDGYTMTLTYEQAQGKLMVYDSNGQALKVTDLETLLITSSKGEIFSSDLPRLAFSSSDGALSDGHFWIKSIAKLKIVPGVSDWEIKLSGIENAILDRPSFESLATCGSTPHPAITFETTTKEGDKVTYEGVPLWIVISMIDGGDDEGGHYQFNTDLANKGYGIQVVATDGFFAEFTSEEVARNSDILLAYKVNGQPLPEDEGPLKMVGSGLPSKKHGIKQIAEIRLVNLPK